MNDRSALVLAFDDHFALGARVCLYSVLRHNPWFDARVIVLCDPLAADSRAALERLYPIEFVNTDPALKAAADGAARRCGMPANVARRLYSLQLFALPGLERAVFLDADTLCLGDVHELFAIQADFAAAPDHVEWRRRLSVDGGQLREPYGRALAYCFNTGVLSVSGRWLRSDVYLELLQLPGLADSHGAHRLADQYVLNHYFDGKVSALDARYNFLISAEAPLRKVYGLTLADVRILHFAGEQKPWAYGWEEARQRVPSRFLRYHDLWQEHRQALAGGLTDEEVVNEYRAGLEELSVAARVRGA